MTTSETLQKALSTSESATIKNIIGRTIIVEWGTVKEILGDGSVVEVLLSVTDRPENATIVTCTLISPCAKNLAVNITPSVGDKVLVLSPRFFDQDMFDVTENTEVIVQNNSAGYNKMTCLAILYNQFREDTHKNFIDFTDGHISAKLDKVEVSTTANGDINIKNPKATVDIDKDGNVKVNAQGKYTLKNATKDLLSVISSLNGILKQLETTGSSSAQTISPDTIALLENWENTDLKALLSST